MWNGTATFSKILWCILFLFLCKRYPAQGQCNTVRILKRTTEVLYQSKEETNVLQNLKNVLKPSLLKKIIQVKCSRVHEPTVYVLSLRIQPWGSAQHKGGGTQATFVTADILNSWIGCDGQWSCVSHSLLECTWVAEMRPRQDSEQRTMIPSPLVSELKIWLPKFTLSQIRVTNPNKDVVPLVTQHLWDQLT